MLKKFLICEKGIHHTHHYLTKISFSNTIVNIFTFTSSMVSVITIILVIYLYCKHKHIKTMIVSLILCKAKEVEANTPTEPENTECQTLAYIGITLTLLSMMIFVLLHYRRSKFCRGYRFSNVVKIVLFISDVQHYIPVKLTKNIRKSPLIQIHRHTIFRGHKTKQKLLTGYIGYKLE